MVLLKILGGTFDFYFSKNNSLFLLKGLKGFYVLHLSSYFFFKILQSGLSFIFFSKYFFKSFIRNFLLFCRYLISTYYFKLKLKGLGFRVKRISNRLYRFFFTFVNFFYFHVPYGVILKTKGRRLFFFSLDVGLLRIVIAHLLLLKKLIVYRIRGLLYPRQIVIMKPGKKKF
jgi:hypothetical protein